MRLFEKVFDVFSEIYIFIAKYGILSMKSNLNGKKPMVVWVEVEEIVEKAEDVDEKVKEDAKQAEDVDEKCGMKCGKLNV